MHEESMKNQREYRGFQIDVCTLRTTTGGYVASVTLTPAGADAARREFALPLDEDLSSEEEAKREAMQYGADLVDGLLPWFDPRSCTDHRPADL
jgi:hypothetical protein